MIISTRENITENIECEEIYQCLINEILYLCANEHQGEYQITALEHSNPFVDESSSSKDSVDTFIQIGSLAVHIRENVAAIFNKATPLELKRFVSFLHQIKNYSSHYQTKFTINTKDFLNFLRSYYESTKGNKDPLEVFIQTLERDGNRKIIESLAIKYFKIIFFQQHAKKISFFELSIISNLIRIHFSEDKYIQAIGASIQRTYILSIARNYQCNSNYTITPSFLSKFSYVIDCNINAFNGTISEVGVLESDVSKIIFTIMCFYLNRRDSIFLKYFSDKELFYCALRSVYQGYEFAKKLECFIITKLRWRLKADEEEYTIDKVYQTIFKYEFKKIIGNISLRKSYLPKYSCKMISSSTCSNHSDDGNRVLVTKVVQTTPKSKKSQESYAFSPLSRRIGEATQNKEGLDSKRKLRFE